MMSRRTLLVGSFGLLLIGGVFIYALFQKGGQRKVARRQDQVAHEIGKVTEAMTTSLRNFNPVLPTQPRPKTDRPALVTVNRATEYDQTPRPPATSLTIFAADPRPEKPPSRGPKGDYAPAFRLVKCQLVNTVDSSILTTPIIGLVTDDLWWNGKLIIRANSEVHGVASVDPVRERIASKGDFTFVLNEPDGLGRELVIRGLALDMERGEEFDTYGITDGSAGLRGDVIRTANSDVIKLYAASLINGVAGAFSGGGSGILGNRVYTNSNSLGLSALQGGVIGPVAGGTQGVLDRYAEQIASSIARDGFFVRVPAGKQFYVYCTEAIDLSKATLAGDEERLGRQRTDSELQRQREEVRRALPVDAAELINPLLPALGLMNQNKK
ncbi:MAG: hypothetical protein WB586_14315 [Chthoniobacterales bacterium]